MYESSLETGSLWLRSDQYFRNIDDEARKDRSEGANGGKTSVPLCFKPDNGPQIIIQGDGQIGQEIRPHYIFSLHGPSISTEQRLALGGCTFGIKIISKLSAEILYRCSQEIECVGYRYGQVYYQFAPLSQSCNSERSTVINLGGKPPVSLNLLNTDVLRKQPLSPFIEQDEWRIVVFTDGYVQNDPNCPLQIQVSPSHFYPYLVSRQCGGAPDAQHI